MAETHGAYRALRLAKRGKLPDKRTRLGTAIAAIEKRVIEHFGELNHLQQIQLFNMMPLICFLVQHPMLVDGSDKIADDYKWAYCRVERGLKILVELGDAKPANKVPTLRQIIAEHGKK